MTSHLKLIKNSLLSITSLSHLNEMTETCNYSFSEGKKNRENDLSDKSKEFLIFLVWDNLISQIYNFDNHTVELYI